MIYREAGPVGRKHRTMDWREACGLIEMIYRTVKRSVIFPTHSFDFWIIPYLMEQGISIDELKQFLEHAQDLLLKGLRAPVQSHDLPFVSETPRRTALRGTDLHPTFPGTGSDLLLQREENVKSGGSG